MIKLRTDQQGSLPLVLLVSIVVGGIIIALFTEVVTGQQSATRDRDVNASIQVADAGLQSAFSQLSSVDPDDEDLPDVGDDMTVEGTVDEGEFTYTARRISHERWQVRSEGTYRGSSRALEAVIGARQIFPLAAFGDVKIEMRGANSVDSYDGVSWGTGRGSVGSNGEVVLRGNAETDWVVRYGDATYNGGGTVHEGIETVTEPAHLTNLAEEAYAEGGDCFGVDAQAYNGEFDLVRGTTYCFSSVSFPEGENTLAGDPEDGPVIIYIAPSGNLNLEGQGEANPSKTNIEPTDHPDSSALQIYLASGEVHANNHSQIAAGIFAPTSNCSGPNAQGVIYGSLVCRTIDNKGGWSFHYDERLADITEDVFDMSSWREELMGTSSFMWDE